jgi:WD40 repeat protein
MVRWIIEAYVGSMRKLLLLTVSLLLGLTACPGRGGTDPGPSSSPSAAPPPAGLSLLYAVTGLDAPARINRYDLLEGKVTTLTVDRSSRFGELVGANEGRDERRTNGAWLGSPSGRLIAYLTSRDLRVASAADPLRFRSVARPRTFRESFGATTSFGFPNLSHVMWAADDSRLFYLESTAAPKPPPNVETYGAPAETRLHEVRPDGSHHRLVKRFRNPKFLQLVGSDLRREVLYWVQTGEGGGGFNLTAVSMRDGSTHIVDALPPFLPVSWIKVAPAGDRAYFIDGERSIVEIDLVTEKRRLIFQGGAHSAPLQGLEISPDGRQVLFVEGNEGDVSARLLTLADGSSRELYRGTDGRAPGSWSPDGRYLVLEDAASCYQSADDPTIGVLDSISGRTSRVRGTEIPCPPVETDRGTTMLRSLTWLVV